MADDNDVCLDTVLTLSNGADRSCVCLSRSVVAAFLALAHCRLLPHPGEHWATLVAGYSDVGPDTDISPLYTFTSLIRKRIEVDGFPRLMLHAAFEKETDRSLISRWTIVATILLLIDVGHLPKCPDEWHAELKRMFNVPSPSTRSKGTRDA
ncbi:hypothetical protein [uncultured Tateyamaria sp.]|uniref:hypothetical protein n=1 Tax=uncultured Tateyamaria sp. TaxID=455651 RepID=UPI00261A8597|nr:hypothetical protein [uncultured Tateyamaria sp.]